MNLSQRLKVHLDNWDNEMITVRRDLHRNPESMFDVERTASLVAQQLEEWGLEVRRNVGKRFKAGVVGILRGGLPGRTIMLRADMDALPIQEQTETPYRSLRDGFMHACGHDAHTAMLLGAAYALSREAKSLSGAVFFVFQPAEEGARPCPEDGSLVSGSRDLIDDGVLDEVELGFALHVWPDLPTGTIGLKEGYIMAASSHFTYEFHGLSGHHATPHLAVDALVMTAQFVIEAKTAAATQWNPLVPAVLSFGTMQAGTVLNAIADAGKVTGSFRTFGNEAVQRMKSLLETRAESVAQSFGGTYTSRYRLGTALLNNAEIVQMAANAAVTGGVEVEWLEAPSLAGEDFALYAERIPCAFAFLGIRNEELGIVHPLHHPRFDVDESALIIGAGVHIRFVLEALGHS
ncbi:amidohydrolase [Paenibacillus sp. HWE-109]|uniref:M20 metallopeptidase family protein n=1 Tax=Paenibacillus sp. HWE-109 TaxID=1306526 RepID=UPI001EE05AC5|nr:amidohydrolase [Paenibacillus sp. HWE-109]UKS29333.1 amidohydrolase [Paenibacillus sp. HWE-109]